MNRTVVNYGFFSGLLCSVLFLGPIVFMPEGYMNKEDYFFNAVIGYSIMFLSMIPVYFGIRSYRYKKHTGNFNFLRAFGTGLLITLVAFILFYLANILVYEVLSPNFLSEFAMNYNENMLSMDLTDAERQSALKEIEDSRVFFENSYLYAFLMASTILLMGVLISLISALLLKRKEIKT